MDIQTSLTASAQFQLDTLRKMAAEGYTYGEISAAIGVPIKRLYWVRCMYGRDITVTRDPKAQAKAGNRAFSDEEIEHIYALKNTNVSERSVCEIYGVTPGVIGDIWKGKTYREVTKQWRENPTAS